MKKLLCMVLALVTMCAGALACETLLPREAGAAGEKETVFRDCSAWAVEADSRELAGIRTPDERLEMKKGYAGTGRYIRGSAQGGLIRAKCLIPVTVTAEAALGLTRLDNVVIRIRAEYLELVAQIVEERIGTELSAAAIAAATMWRREGAVAHIFWPEETPVLAVGSVTFNGGEFTVELWAGDFDGDGGLELGFRFGIPWPTIPKATEEPAVTPEPEPEATPEPTAAPTKKPQPKPVETQKPACEPTCQPEPCGKAGIKVCWDIGVWFKGCITLLQGCMK